MTTAQMFALNRNAHRAIYRMNDAQLREVDAARMAKWRLANRHRAERVVVALALIAILAACFFL